MAEPTHEGVRYVIDVQGNLDARLRRAVEAVGRLDASFDRLRARAEALAQSDARLSRASDQQATSAERAERSATRRAAAADRETRILTSRERAERAYVQALRRTAQAQSGAELAAEKNFRAERRRLTQTQVRQRAEQQTTTALDRRAVAERQAEVAARGGFEAERARLTQAQTRQAAERQTTRSLDRQATAEQQAALAAERGFEAERRRQTQAQARQAAERRLTQALDRQAQTDAARQVAREREISLSDRQARSLGVLTQRQIELASARNRVEATRAGVTDGEIQQLREEDAALRRLVRAQQQLAATEQAVRVAREDFGVDLLALEQEARLKQRISRADAARADAERLLAAGRVELVSNISLLTQEQQAKVRLAQADQARAEAEQLLQANRPDLIRNVSLLDDELRQKVLIAKADEKRTQAEALLRLGRDARGNKQLTAEEQEKLQIVQLDRQRIALERSLQQTQQGGNAEVLRLQAQVDYLKRISSLKRQQAVDDIFRQQGVDPQTGERVQRNLFGISNALDQADKRANRVSFTFRRLFGILAAFTAARLAVQGFFAALREGLRFNSLLEDSRLGIAGLIAATSNLVDLQGRSVSATEGLVIAQGEARRQMQLLRRDALATAGTLENVLEAFRVGLAPGIQAGLSIDEVRRFSVEISQAAAALGLAQNQLAEEIRSILQGTITTRNTRIAVALGITPADIRRAKELGILNEFLQERFEAFRKAGEESLQNLSVILTNLADATRQVLGAGGEELFEDLKGFLGGILDSLRQITDEGVQLDPEAVAVARILFEAIRSIVTEAEKIGKALSFTDLLPSTLAAGAAFREIAFVVGAFVQGLVEGTRDAVLLLKEAADLIARVAEPITVLDRDDVRDSLVLLARMAAVLGTILVAGKSLRLAFVLLAGTLTHVVSLMRSIVLLVPRLQKAAKAVGATAALTGGPILAALVAVAAVLLVISKLTREWASDVKGVETSFDNAFDLLVLDVLGFVQKLRANLRVVIKEIEISSREAILKLKILTAGILKEIESVLRVLAAFSTPARAALQALEKFNSKGVEDLVRELAQARAELLGLEKDADTVSLRFALLGQQILQAILQGRYTSSFKQGVADVGDALQESVREALEAIGKELGLGLQDVNEEASKLSGLFGQLPPAIGRAKAGLDEAEGSVGSFADDLRQARQELELATRSAGLQGRALERVRQELETSTLLQERTRELAIERTQAEQRLADVQSRRLALERQTADLSQDDRDRVEAGVEALKKALDTRRLLLAAEKEASLAAAQTRADQNIGSEEQAKRAQERQKELEAIRDEVKGQLQDQLEAADTLLRRSGESGDVAVENAQRLRSVVEERLAVLQEETGATAALVALAEARRKIEEDVRRSAELRSQALAIEAEAALRQESPALQRELQLQRDLLAAERERLGIKVDLARTTSDLRAEADELFLRRTQLNIEERLLQNAIEKTESQQTRVALERQLVALQQNGNDELAAREIALERLARRLADLQLRLERPLSQGVQNAFREFEERASDAYQNTFALLTSTLNGFSDAAADTIVSIFDPNAGDLRERWGRFFLDISRQAAGNLVDSVLEKIGSNLPFLQPNADIEEETTAALTQQALEAGSDAVLEGAYETSIAAGALSTAGKILGGASTGLGTAAGAWTPVASTLAGAAGLLLAAATILAGTGFAGAGAHHGGLVGRHSGGLVPASGAVPRSRRSGVPRGLPSARGLHSGGPVRPSGRLPSPAHLATPQGLWRGGLPLRPSGLHPRDTVPIWAEPGEHVDPVASVKKYGADLFELLRRRTADRDAVRSAAGLASRVRVGTSPPRILSQGRQGGGPIFARRAATGGDPGARRPEKLEVLVRTALVESDLDWGRMRASGFEREVVEIAIDHFPEIQGRGDRR